MDNLEYPLSPFITPVARGRPAPRWSMRCPEVDAQRGWRSALAGDDRAVHLRDRGECLSRSYSMLRPDQHIHFVGVGGFGMSAIARVLLQLGYTVSGRTCAPTR